MIPSIRCNGRTLFEEIATQHKIEKPPNLTVGTRHSFLKRSPAARLTKVRLCVPKISTLVSSVNNTLFILQNKKYKTKPKLKILKKKIDCNSTL
jgi:hypothetical protein